MVLQVTAHCRKGADTRCGFFGSVRPAAGGRKGWFVLPLGGAVFCRAASVVLGKALGAWERGMSERKALGSF